MATLSHVLVRLEIYHSDQHYNSFSILHGSTVFVLWWGEHCSCCLDSIVGAAGEYAQPQGCLSVLGHLTKPPAPPLFKWPKVTHKRIRPEFWKAHHFTNVTYVQSSQVLKWLHCQYTMWVTHVPKSRTSFSASYGRNTWKNTSLHTSLLYSSLIIREEYKSKSLKGLKRYSDCQDAVHASGVAVGKWRDWPPFLRMRTSHHICLLSGIFDGHYM